MENTRGIINYNHSSFELFFYRDLKRYFLKKEGKDFKNNEDNQIMNLKLQRIFSYKEIYK
jgi:hypothetical protein